MHLQWVKPGELHDDGTECSWASEYEFRNEIEFKYATHGLLFEFVDTTAF